MPILVTGTVKPWRPAQRRARGFTLIEILIVMVIIGVLAGIAGLVLTDHAARRAQQEAQRLQQTLMLLREQALLENRQYALQFASDGYRVLQLQLDQRWHSDAGFRARQWHPSVRMKWQIAGAELLPLAALTSLTVALPQLLILPNDETDPFVIDVLANGQRVGTLDSDGIAPVRYVPVQEAVVDTRFEVLQ